jgi:hypothetical protein
MPDALDRLDTECVRRALIRLFANGDDKRLSPHLAQYLRFVLDQLERRD